MYSDACDFDSLARRLRKDGIEIGGRVTATSLGLGQSNLTYLMTDDDGGRWVVRRPPLGRLLASAHDVEREARIIDALEGTSVPVPAVIARYNDSAIADAPVVVLEHVEGLVIDHLEIAESLNTAVRAALGPELARSLSSIHAVDLAAAGLNNLASHSSYAARQLKRWSGQWERSKLRDLPELDALTEMLHAKIPVQREVSLVHGDFHLRNVIVDGLTGEVRAVLDWELCTLGDPIADIGSLLAYWPEPTDPPTDLFAASTLPGFADRASVADAYLAASGRDGSSLEYWHVLGLWKIAIIGEGVRRRALEDPRNAAGGSPPSTEFVDLTIDRAHNVARSAGWIA